MILDHQSYSLAGKVILERFRFKPPLESELKMVNEACFYYSLKGISDVYTPSEKVQLSTQEGLLMKCGNYLGSIKEFRGNEIFETLVVHFYPDVLNEIYRNELPDFLTNPTPVQNIWVEKIGRDAIIQNYVEGLEYYFKNPSLIDDDLLKIKVKELILLLVKTGSSHGIINILKDLFRPNDYSLKQLIHSHLFEDFSIEKLAFLAGMSESTFKRKFKEVFNDSPAKYIRTKRLEKAKELIGLGNQSIADIAYDCGFNDPKQFTKAFKAHFGLSPSEIRK